MSQEEVNRLVGDVMNDPALMAEAMAIRDQAGMEALIDSRGYDLTDAEKAEVWAMANRLMAGKQS